MKLRFALVSEGSSDWGLVPHIEAMCVEAGAQEASGTVPAFHRLRAVPGKSVQEQVHAALVLEPDIDAIFVHRDADSISPETRIRQIKRAAAGVPGSPRVVPVVPVQETEAWLLVDEAEIRAVAGRPSGRIDLELPRLSRIESTPSPKEVLKRALVLASGATGRRRETFTRAFPAYRATLLERLDRTGPVGDLPSWRALQDRVRHLVEELSIARAQAD